ncbi:MAG TPA: hypothetical protein VD789_08810 [Thermomicrobiales bacterium]|nr:hypothetical protein [Thermomicrobiales bacterium]
MTESTAQETAHSLPRVVVLSRDLFFGMRIRNALKQMGFATVIRKSEAELDDELAGGSAALALIDFNSPVDWTLVSGTIAAHGDLPVVAFGSHTDTEAFRLAREAGVTRVIANGAFSQQLPDLIERYARR